MKYYISKPISHKLDDSIVIGVKEMDSEAVFVKSLYDADICIFQKGWKIDSDEGKHDAAFYEGFFLKR